MRTNCYCNGSDRMHRSCRKNRSSEIARWRECVSPHVYTFFLGQPSTNQFTCGSEFFQCPPVCLTHRRRGVVVSSVRRMNEVNARRARLVPGWVTGRAGIPSRYVTSQLGQLSLASLQGRLIEYQLRLGVRAGMSPLPGGR